MRPMSPNKSLQPGSGVVPDCIEIHVPWLGAAKLWSVGSSSAPMRTRVVPLLGVFVLLFGSGPVKADENTKNLLVIGRSSLASPIGLDLLVGALLKSNKTPM